MVAYRHQNEAFKMVLATHYILLYLSRDLQQSSVTVDLFKQLVLGVHTSVNVFFFFFSFLFSFKRAAVLYPLHQAKRGVHIITFVCVHMLVG